MTEKIKKAIVENKNVMSLIDTDSHNLSKLSVSEKYIWYLWQRTRGLKANESVDISLPIVNLHLTKDDDGIYSGFVTKIEQASDTIDKPLQIEKRTIPEIVSMLEVKEFIEPVAVENQKEKEISENVDAVATLVATNETISDKPVTININIQKSEQGENKMEPNKSIRDEIIESIKKAKTSIDEAIEDVKGEEELQDTIKKLPPEKRDDFLRKLREKKKKEDAKKCYQKDGKPRIRRSITKDLSQALIKSGYTTQQAIEEVKKSKNINELISKLSPQHQKEFNQRINGQKELSRQIEDIKKSVEMPKTLDSDADIVKAKQAFSKCLKELGNIKGKDKASATVYAIFKSVYGVDGMKKIKKSIKQKKETKTKTDKSVAVKLGDVFAKEFKLMKAKIGGNQPEEVKKAFIEDPMKKWERFEKK